MRLARCPSTRLNGIFHRAGQGIVAFVGAGRLRIKQCPDRFLGGIGYAPKTQVGWYAEEGARGGGRHSRGATCVNQHMSLLVTTRFH
jgi:hypothetical protein